MRFAVIGAGAIGAFIGASLARAGFTTTLFARGEHLAAMREHGVRIQSANDDFTIRLTATDDLASIGEVDVVLLTLKAHQIEPIAAQIGLLFDPNTALVSMQNGIPWWYFSGDTGPNAGRRVFSVDPQGTIGAAIAAHRVVGCVIYLSAEIIAPGVIRHGYGARLNLGDGSRTTLPRTRQIAEALAAAGIEASVTPDIRVDIWTKLAGNATLNPISALTRATVGELCSDPGTESVIAGMMHETLNVAAGLGIEVPISVEQRIATARTIGSHRTSMLQDLSARKQLELDALLGAVVELGKIAGVATPISERVYAICKLLERSVLAGR